MNKYSVDVITNKKEVYGFATEAKNKTEASEKVKVCMKIEKPEVVIEKIRVY